jgi:hypothetical protein
MGNGSWARTGFTHPLLLRCRADSTLLPADHLKRKGPESSNQPRFGPSLAIGGGRAVCRSCSRSLSSGCAAFGLPARQDRIAPLEETGRTAATSRTPGQGHPDQRGKGRLASDPEQRETWAALALCGSSHSATGRTVHAADAAQANPAPPLSRNHREGALCYGAIRPNPRGSSHQHISGRPQLRPAHSRQVREATRRK